MLHQLMLQLLVHLFHHQIQEPLKFEKKNLLLLVYRLHLKFFNPVKICMHVNGQLPLLTSCMMVSFV